MICRVFVLRREAKVLRSWPAQCQSDRIGLVDFRRINRPTARPHSITRQPHHQGLIDVQSTEFTVQPADPTFWEAPWIVTAKNYFALTPLFINLYSKNAQSRKNNQTS
jgi:hypothetical protein